MTLFQKDFLIGLMRSMDYCRSWKYVFLKMPQVTATKLPMVGGIKLPISWCLVKLVCLWGSGYACFAPTLQQSHSCFCLMAWWLNGWHYLIEYVNKALVFQYIRCSWVLFQAFCQPLRRYFVLSYFLRIKHNIDQCSGCESCCWNRLSRWRWRSSELLKTWHLRSQLCAPWTWDLSSCFAFWEVGRLPFSIICPFAKCQRVFLRQNMICKMLRLGAPATMHAREVQDILWQFQ